MSGHSKWSSIKHKKAVKDARRGETVYQAHQRNHRRRARRAAATSMPIPRLRTAVLTARANSMPSDNIDRAIKKGTGELEAFLRGDPLRGLRSRWGGDHGASADR